MTKEQATKIANNIYNGKFGVYAYGNFDIDAKEFATLLLLADTPLANEHLEKYYNELRENVQ